MGNEITNDPYGLEPYKRGTPDGDPYGLEPYKLPETQALTPKVYGVTPDVAPVELPEEGYNRDELGRFIEPIRKYNYIMRGSQSQDWADEEQIENYTNAMRWFDAGNSVITVREIGNLVSLDEEQKAAVGEAYSIWQNMDGLFNSENTWGETWSGVGDYTKAITLDPVNLVGLRVGKLFSMGGTKAATKAAQVAAMEVYKESLKKATQKGFTKELTREAAESVARKEADKVWVKTMQEAAVQSGKEITERTARGVSTTEALKEAGVVIALDTAVNIGTEIAYQNALIQTGVQDDYNANHVALAAIGSMVLGGVALAGAKATGVSGFKPTVDLPEIEKAPKELLDSIIVAVGKSVARDDSWKEKVARGFEIKDLDHDFWHSLLMDEENGILVSMQKAGYLWYRSGPDDKISNFVADALKTADPVDAKHFMDEFVSKTGLRMPEMEDVPLGTFADNLALKMNQAAKIMNDMMQISKKLGKPADKVTLNDLAEEALDVGIEGARSFSNKTLERLSKGTTRAQSNLLRLIVSNLSTTRLNLVGYAASSMMNSASDIAMASLYGGEAFLRVATGDVKNAKKLGEYAKTLVGMQIQKAKNLIDPNTTLDQFNAMSLIRPHGMGELTHTLAGGIENTAEFARRNGFNPEETIVGSKTEDVVDFIGKINLVKAQDIYTKSQEFIYQMDKNLRLTMGRSLQEVWADPKVREIMATPDYAKAEAKSVFETQSAIYSVSYKRQGGEIGRIAGFLEDFRKIPVVGVTIPFGRFFNNVVATTMTNSGGMLLAKALGNKTQRGYKELATRAALGWGIVGVLVEKEKENIANGLDIFDQPDPNTGEIKDIRYTFPYSLFKGAARIVAYKQAGEVPPDSFVEQMADAINVFKTVHDFVMGEGEVPENTASKVTQYVVGQLTRQLSEAGMGVAAVAEAILQGDPHGEDMLTELMMAPIVQSVSGSTRFLEPANVIVKLIQGTDMRVIDKRQGNKMLNESLRYIDAFVGGEQKYSAASGKAGIQPEKFISERTRNLSNTERAMNLVGAIDWKTSSFTQNPAADNRFNQLFHLALDDEAGKLMKNEKYTKGTLESRELMWSTAMEKARTLTNQLMAVKVNKEGVDPLLQMSLKISSGNSRKDITEALDKIAGGRKIEELSYNELSLLKVYLDTREDLLKIKDR